MSGASWVSVVERTVVGLGYDLVDVERGSAGLVRVTIDRVTGDPRGEFIVVDDCERVTRQLQHVLEVEGLDYSRLEVSSPGLDRPLRREADFVRHAGETVTLTLKQPYLGRKRFQGQLLVPEGESAWRLVLAEPQAAKPARRGKAPKAAPAAGVAAASAPAMPDSDPVLEFRLDEVREARLVPVVDFKGRRLQPEGPPSPSGGAPAEGEVAQ